MTFLSFRAVGNDRNVTDYPGVAVAGMRFESRVELGAKKPETRAARIEKTVSGLRAGRKTH